MIIHDSNGQPYDADLVEGEEYRELERKVHLMQDSLASKERQIQSLLRMESNLIPVLLVAADALDETVTLKFSGEMPECEIGTTWRVEANT